MTHISTQHASCPQCGGFPDYDEEGKAYTCYFCCDTGTVDAATAEAYYRAIDDRAEKFAPRLLGIFPRQLTSEYDEITDEEAEAEKVPGHRLFTGLWEIERSIKKEFCARVFAAHCADAGIDDIPF